MEILSIPLHPQKVVLIDDFGSGIVKDDIRYYQDTSYRWVFSILLMLSLSILPSHCGNVSGTWKSHVKWRYLCGVLSITMSLWSSIWFDIIFLPRVFVFWASLIWLRLRIHLCSTHLFEQFGKTILFGHFSRATKSFLSLIFYVDF